jgi:hypothetical protein
VHADLERVAGEFAEAQARMHRLAESVEDRDWNRRPAAGAWSMDECVAHLTITNERYVPILAEVADTAPELSDPATPMHRDLTGRLLCWFMEPPVRFKLPTAAGFEPPSSAGRPATVARFDAVQSRLVAVIRTLDGLDLTRVRMASPFNAKVRYSTYSALYILAAHERRHLWQAERVRTTLSGTAS